MNILQLNPFINYNFTKVQIVIDYFINPNCFTCKERQQMTNFKFLIDISIHVEPLKPFELMTLV